MPVPPEIRNAQQMKPAVCRRFRVELESVMAKVVIAYEASIREQLPLIRRGWS